MQISTAGDLRGFLADILVSIRDGKINSQQALAISKVAAQINQSLSVEVNTALQLERMGKDRPIAGSMLLRSEVANTPQLPATEADDEHGADEEPDQRERVAAWIEKARERLMKMESDKDLETFIARNSDALERLMEEMPDLHAEITIAINETRERLRPNQLDRIDRSLREDLLWCDQCDDRVAPEEAAGCKSRHCSLKKVAA